MTDPPAPGLLVVDLGSSNTVAILHGDDGRARPLLFDGSELLPSAVFLADDGTLHVGRDAALLARDAPARYEPHPKRRIGEGTVLLGESEVSVVTLLAAVLRRVADEARRVTGGPPATLLTHPVAWGSGRRGVLADAAARAGLPVAGMVAEPIAAAAYFTDVLGSALPVGHALAVFDFGGGTLDVAVVRRTGDGPQVVATGGLDSVGGIDLDAAVIAHLERQLPAEDAWHRLARPTGPADLRDRNQLWQDVRLGKEMLSRSTTATVHVPGLASGVHLTRGEFEALAGPALRRTVAETAETLRRAGLGREELAGVFLVGGSSRIPLLAGLLHRALGVAPTVLERPETAVAEGAGHTDAAPRAATTFAGALRAVRSTDTSLGGSPVVAGPDGTAPAAARRRRLSRLLAGFVAVAAAGTTLAITQPWRGEHPAGPRSAQGSAGQATRSAGGAPSHGSPTPDPNACPKVGDVNELVGGSGDRSFTVGVVGTPYCYRGWFYYSFNLQKNGQTMQSTSMVLRRKDGTLRKVLGAEAGMVCTAPPPDPESHSDKPTWHAKEFWAEAPKRFIRKVCPHL